MSYYAFSISKLSSDILSDICHESAPGKSSQRETAQTESNRMNPELGSLLLACSSGTFHDAELPARIQPS